MTPLALARATRALIATPATWTQSAWARDREGRSVDACSPLAVCWCYSGALTRAASAIRDGDERRDVLMVVYNTVRIVSGTGAISLNDKRGHAAVLATLDAVIDRLIGDI